MSKRKLKAAGSVPENNLKATIEKIGISQERAARLLGVAFSTFNAWANRKIAPNAETLRAVATLDVLHREANPTWCKEGEKIAEDVGAIRKHSRTCERCLTAIEYLYRETR
jgi:transcriptional regulator with XRE-family HTH domain